MKWYYWVIVLGVLAVMYVMLIARQKRQEKQNKEMLDSFQVGDKVITHIGIYGKIRRIYNTTFGKVCVLEIGEGKNKVEVEMDIRYIAGKDEKTLVLDEPKEEKVEEIKQEQPQEAIEEKVEEEKLQSVVEEKVEIEEAEENNNLAEETKTKTKKAKEPKKTTANKKSNKKK